MRITYVVIKISPEAYKEVRRAVIEAGYESAVYTDAKLVAEFNESTEVIDLHGLAVSEDKPRNPVSHPDERPIAFGGLKHEWKST